MTPTRVFQAKPKTKTVLMYNREFFITLHHSQKWEVHEFEIAKNIITYTVSWKCVRINLTQSRFWMLFKKVKE